MTVSVVVTVSGAKEVQDALRDPQLIKGPLKGFLREAANIVEIEAKHLVPVDTGRLRASIVRDIAPLSARVYTNVVYAPAVELGRGPHYVSPAALRLWAKRKGLNPYAISAVIAKRGTKAHPYMRPAGEKLKGRLAGLLDTLAAGIRQGFRRHTHGRAK